MNKRFFGIFTAAFLVFSSFYTVSAYKTEGLGDYWYTEDFDNWDKSEIKNDDEIRLNAISKNDFSDLDVDITRIALPNDNDDALKIMGFFRGIGVLSKDYRVYDVITRAQAADIIAKLLAYKDDLGLYSGTVFSDVSDKDFASSSISYVHARGIMNGTSADIFSPNEYFYYDHALASLVRMLGYEVKAQAKGGYPIGYKLAANDLGILNSTNKSSNTDLVGMGAFCTMLFNCLEIPMIDSYSYSSDIDISGSNSRTILTDCLKMAKTEGILNAVENLDLYGKGENLDSDVIEIDGVKYKIESKEYKKFFGMKVEMFTSLEKGRETARVYYLTPSKNVKKTTLYASDISFKSSSVIAKKAKNGEKEQEFKLSGNKKILYNGSVMAELTQNIMPKCGRLALISNENKSYYDTVIIYDYSGFVVNGVSDTRILFKYNDTINIDGKEKSYIEIKENTPYSILKDGEFISLSDVKKDGAVFIAYNPTNGFIMEYSEDSIEGEITEIRDNPYRVMIEDELYEVENSYLKLCDSNAKDTAKIDFGVFARFVLSPFGTVVGILDAEEKEFEYGYALGILAADKFDPDNVRIKLFSFSSNSVKELSFKDNITLNGVKTTPKAVYNELKTKITQYPEKFRQKNMTDDEIAEIRNNPPIIKYKTYKKDIINEIVTNIIDKSDDETLQNTNIVRHRKYAQRRCFQQYKTLGREILFTESSTYALKIPDSLNEKDFISGRVSRTLPAGNDTDIMISSYDSDEFDVPKIVIWFGSGGGQLKTSNSVMMVESVSRGINSDGDNSYIINGMSASKGALSLLAEDDDELNAKIENLKKGDIISCAVSDSNVVTGISINASYGITDIYTFKDNLVYDNKEVLFGEVGAINETYIKLKSYKQGAIAESVNQTVKNTRYLIYDGNEMKQGTYADIEAGDLLFMQLYLTNMEDVLVYKKN